MRRRRGRRPEEWGLGATGEVRLLPYGLLMVGALVAPWLRGGRSPDALWILGSIGWLGVVAAVWVSVYGLRYEVNGRRLLRGLLWGLPAIALVGLMGVSAFNPIYEAVAGSVPRVLRLAEPDFGLPVTALAARSQPAIYFLSGYIVLAVLLLNREIALPSGWRRVMILCLLVNAALLCAVGLYYKLTGSKLMLGSYPVKAGYFFATFYYKNHWAAYGVLYLAVAIGFFFRDLPRWTEDGRRAGGGALALIAALFLAVSFPLAESRSGVVLVVVAAVLMAVGVIRALPRTRVRWIGGGLLVAFVGGVVGLAAIDLEDEWQRTTRQVERSGSVVFDGIRAQHGPTVCIKMLGERPVTGWGLYSFDPLFPIFATDFFRHSDGRMRYRMEFAHNDWLQFTAELGLLGMGLLLAGGLIGLIGGGFGGTCAVSRWALVGVGLVLLMAAWEFPFSNPAVMANALALYTLALSQRRA